MKTRAFFALAIFGLVGIFISELQAQQSPVEAEIDSLKGTLSQYSRQDTNYIYSLFEIGFQNQNSESQKLPRIYT
ncbi:hypothetical protein D5R40_29885 [Okeania hirsuta]|uniref:Uncharacterized protein n=1 Tax=Okeania hirsuta TaxID=1458930 RepID=A0A3N6PF89_9CYAN|nr:hypothetical protein D5R40_29885 [Okeania hirsuta]